MGRVSNSKANLGQTRFDFQLAAKKLNIHRNPGCKREHRVIKHPYGLLWYFLPNLLQLSGQVINIPWQIPSYHIPDMLHWPSGEMADQSPAVKRNGTPDCNPCLRACVACSSESRISTLSWASPDTSSVIVKTQLETGFITEHYMPLVNMIPI
ncbi:hypothetical protein TNCV_327491 [Trichonephila clavipes]|nr:hypothetical protein TNCV_327491 [Trichonephila clavipes]